METKSYFYAPFSKKADFNNAVGHCQAVITILGADNENIADTINTMILDKEIVPDEVLPIVSVVLLDKKNYYAYSVNLEAVCKSPKEVIDEISTWKGVDVVLGYHHPDMGFLLFNPKNPANTGVLDGLRKNELLNIYVGKNGNELDKKIADTVAEAVTILIYENKKTTLPAEAKSGNFVFKTKEAKAPKKAPAEKKETVRKAPTRRVPVSTRTAVQTSYSEPQYEVPDYLRKEPSATTAPVGRKNMSPLVSVLVTNELFHNGNVEAWKRIIRAYNAKYQNAEVMVFYDGERIVDINTLFKWGKVKHGTMIQFSVADDEIKDLSKLRKYLAQGASPSFGAFLKGSPDTVLSLF